MAWPVTLMIAAVVASLGMAPAWGQAAKPDGQQKMPGLAELTPMPVPPATLDQLAQVVTQFRHAPFDRAGFNPVVLPFHYGDPTGQGAPEEARAFSFLMSEDLDWVPENYTTRHAYFIFKRDAKLCQALAESYANPKLIADLLKGWNGTHAIGGEINHGEQGYTGTLRIFDTKGAEVYTESFPSPRAFHDLLGDMDLAVMKALGCHPRAELAAHLHKPRCKDPASLALLGEAAFAPERGEEEFGLYKKILENDPGFAEVRYWYGNQTMWETDDRQTYQGQIAESLDTRVTTRFLHDFDPSLCPDKALAAKYPQWVAEAEKIAGPDAPEVLRLRLKQAQAAHSVDGALMARMIQAAGANPNQGSLLEDTAWLLGGDSLNHNSSAALSIYLAEMQSRYLPGPGFGWAANQAAREFLRLGRPREALQVLKSVEDRPPANVNTGFRAMLQAGQFARILDWYHANPSAPGVLDDPALARCVALAACARQDIPTLRTLLQDHAATLRADKLEGVFRNALAEMEGKPFQAQPDAALYEHLDVEQYEVAAVVPVDLDLRSGRNRMRGTLALLLNNLPNDRLLWVLMDQYCRSAPAPADGRFYQALEFLHGDDPWVVEAVARWRQLSVPAPPPQQPEDHDLLTSQESTRMMEVHGKMIHRREVNWAYSPWDIAARVRELHDSGQKTKAFELARKMGLAARETRQANAEVFAYAVGYRALQP